jgi:hypothetical protein
LRAAQSKDPEAINPADILHRFHQLCFTFSMPEPTLTILGIYKPQISVETWQEQWKVTADDEETREHFEKLVLIEGFVDGLNEPFDMGSLGQMQFEFPDDPTRMMVGYDEGLLSLDGETLLARDMNCVEGDGPLRFAVYLHLYDPDRPLKWQCGEVLCPEVQDVPVRLTMLMPYNACS